MEIQTSEIIDLLNKILKNLVDIKGMLRESNDNKKEHKPEYYRVFNEIPKTKSIKPKINEMKIR